MARVPIAACANRLIVERECIMLLQRVPVLAFVCATSIACGSGEEAAAVGEVAGGDSALSSDCTGLVPQSLPTPFAIDWNTGDECGPLGATSDGLSDYTVGKGCVGGFDEWHIFDETGNPTASVAWYRETWDDTQERSERHFLPQPGGGFLAFHWLTESDGTQYHRVVSLRAFAGDGTQTGERFLINLTGATRTSFPDSEWSVAPVVGGGLQISHLSMPGDGTWHVYTQRWTASGNAADGVQQLATAATTLYMPQHIVTGVAIGGQALVAWDNGTQGRAVWTDSIGHLLGGTFGLPFRVDGSVSLAPLLDGTLVFRQGADWTYAVAPGNHTLVAAPSWLSTRPGSVLALVRGGRAHALVTQPPPDSCQAHVVIFAPAGNRCGAIDLPSADQDGCTSGAEFGLDGTVTVSGRTYLVDSGIGPQEHLTERFYPRALK
jgi:hypothetical protein